jgi:hypothetical protein
MTKDSYREALDSALEELTSLSKRKAALMKSVDKIDERIDAVRQGALGLLTLAEVDFQEVKGKYPDLFEEQIDAPMGITDAVREALRTSKEMLTPIEIRDKVFQISPAIAGQKNPLASIHTVLRRLAEKGIVATAMMEANGATNYGWIDVDDWEERLRGWFGTDEDRTAAIEIVRQRREKEKKK